MNIDKLWKAYSENPFINYGEKKNNYMTKEKFTQAIAEIISLPVEAGVMQKPAGSADEIFIKGKIEGLEEARWQINYALPHIDPNGRLEKQTKYLMDAFKEVQDELKAKL